MPSCALEVELGDDEGLACPARVASTTPHGSTIIERPPERMPGACSPTWLAATTKPGPRSRGRAAGSPSGRASSASVNAAGTARIARAAHGEDRGRARGSAGRNRRVSPSPTPPAVSREHDLVARRLVLGLAVDAPADLDVEHVDLAVGRRGSRRRGRRARDVLRSLSSPVDALGERAGDEVDAELARRCSRAQFDGGAVERLGARAQVVAAAEHRPLLGRRTSVAPRSGRVLGTRRGPARRRRAARRPGDHVGARDRRASSASTSSPARSPSASRARRSCATRRVHVGPDGEVRATYRKIHMFDVEVDGTRLPRVRARGARRRARPHRRPPTASSWA